MRNNKKRNIYIYIRIIIFRRPSGGVFFFQTRASLRWRDLRAPLISSIVVATIVTVIVIIVIVIVVIVIVIVIVLQEIGRSNNTLLQ